jgi:hypothetical protein
MKHYRSAKTIFAPDGRHLGTFRFSPRGCQCHDASGKRIGEYQDEAQAVARLRRPPRVTGISTMTSTGHLKRSSTISINDQSTPTVQFMIGTSRT